MQLVKTTDSLPLARELATSFSANYPNQMYVITQISPPSQEFSLYSADVSEIPSLHNILATFQNGQEIK